MNFHNNPGKKKDIFLDLLEETFFSRVNYKNKKRENKKRENKIVMNDFKCQNTIEISHIIKNIKYYYLYYNVIISHQEIKIGEMNTNVFISNTIIPTEKIILFESHKISSIPFFPFFSSLPSPKLLIHHILDSYIYLIKSIQKLHDNNIYLLPIHQHDIVFNERYKPIISNFNNALIMNTNTLVFEKLYLWVENFKENLNTYTDNENAILPFDLYILIHLIDTNYSFSQSSSYLNKIYANNLYNNYFKSFSFSFSQIEEYKTICFHQLSLYLNKTKMDIIKEILLKREYWDSFLLNTFYIAMINDVVDIFSLKNTIINDFQILLKNSLFQNNDFAFLLTTTESLYDTHTDWTFVNTLSYEKLNEFQHKYKSKYA